MLATLIAIAIATKYYLDPAFSMVAWGYKWCNMLPELAIEKCILDHGHEVSACMYVL